MLRPYEPTLRERIAAYFMGDTRPSPERRQFATGIADILSYLPGTGNVIQGEEAYRRGDNKGAILAALPVPGAANVAARAEQEAVKRGIRAFHGSPHSFTKFDMSKIGTGEGAQSYGHGLYFAEAEPVAKQYRDQLSLPLYKGKHLSEFGDTPETDAIAEAIGAIHDDNMSPVDAVAEARRQLLQNAQNSLQSLREDPTNIARQKVARYDIERAKAAQKLDPKEFAENKGSMYEVRINADPEHFLDYDKPLSEQSPYVKDMLSANLENLKANTSILRPTTPEDAARLREAGIPGVKYFDAGSRAAGEGSRNYVVFDDKIVEIMRKYGLMGPIGAGIAAKILERQEQRQEM